MTNQEELAKIKSRSFFSVFSLLFQSSYSAALGFVAFFILTLKSGVYLLGIYNTVLAMMSFFNYVTNLGLAAALIQKKDADDLDLNTTFFIQFFLTLVVSMAGFFFTSYLFHFYKDLPRQATYLYWSILFSFLLLTFKTMPSILLEKKLEIYKVVTIQAIENTLFYLAVIIFSLLGFDIYSLVIAVILRSLVGTVTIFFFQPWWPKFQFSFSRAKTLLKFGIPFQGNSFLSLLKDDLLILYLGSALGLKNLGYVTFAKKYAEFSLRLIVDNINRVAFPLFSKFQHDTNLLKKSLEKVLFYDTLLIFPAIVGAGFVFEHLLRAVSPSYYLKWYLAIPSFYFFSISSFFVVFITPFINLFNAVGKVKISLTFMVLWTVLTWIFVPIAINILSYSGVGVAFALINATFILVIWRAKKILNFSLRQSTGSNFSFTLLIVLYLFICRLFFTNLYLFLVFSIIGAATIYLGLTYRAHGQALIDEFKQLRQNKI